MTVRDIPAEVIPRRKGDPAVLVASSEQITSRLGWRVSRDLRTMVSDAWTYARAVAAPQ